MRIPAEPTMPSRLLNAALSGENDITVRVGIPHRSGRLAFHAFSRGYAAMVSASAFWNARARRFTLPQATDLQELDWALDSAGFTAMRAWQAKGAQAGMAGVYPWSCGQYVELASLMSPTWWAQPDLCCEPAIAHSQEEIDFRIRATATLPEATLRTVYAWQNQLARSCPARVVANMVRPPVPVIQGWTVEHYLRSLDLLGEVWRRWQPWLAPPALIGLGSVCRRHLHHPQHGLLPILAGIEGALPGGAKLHLFGVKGPALAHLSTRGWIASVDSMAYDDGARRSAWERGHANTMQHRSAAMSRWMGAAQECLRPAGDSACGERFGIAVQ